MIAAEVGMPLPLATAVQAGMPSAVVLTGETTSKQLEATPAEDRPSWVLDRIDRLLPASS